MPDDGVDHVLYVGTDREYFTDFSLALKHAHPSFAVNLATDREGAHEFVDRASIRCVVIESTVEAGWQSLLAELRDRAPDVPVVLATDGGEDCTEAAITAGVDSVLDRSEEPTDRIAVGVNGLVDRYRTTVEERSDLDWYEGLLDGMGDFVVVFGADSAVEYVSPSIEHVTGYTPADVRAMGPFGYVHHDDQPDVIDAFYETMLEPAGAKAKVETRAQHADGTWRIHEGVGVNHLGEDPVDGIVVNVRDITDPARPKVLLSEHLDRVTDAFFALDADRNFTYVNRKAEELLGTDEESLLGQPFDVVFDDSSPPEAFESNFERALSSGQSVTFEASYPPTDIWTEVRAYASETGLSVYLRDTTREKERGRELERYETIVETVSDGVLTVDSDGCITFVNEAFVGLSGYGRDELVGEHVSLIADEDTIERGRQLDERRRIDARADAVIEAELKRADGEWIPTETRFAPLPSDGEAPGRVGLVRDISERKRREEQLGALNRLNTIIREINRTLVQTGSREEVEALICERLTESELYSFAWIGTVDPGTGTVVPREWSRREGATEDVLTDLAELDGGGDTPGPVTEAARSRSVQIISDLGTVDTSWGSLAVSHGYRTSIAIPFVYDGVDYGVLSVYSTQPGAFDEEHRCILAQLREVVGHALNAIEREAVLLSDRIVEFKLRSERAAEPFGGLADARWPVTIEGIVSTGEDTSILYLSVAGADPDQVEGILEDVPVIRECRVVRHRGDETLFEVRTTRVTLLPELASYGAYVRNATLADGALTVVAELSPTHDVRAVHEAIRADYPDLEFVSRQFTEHEGRTHVDVKETIETRLTPQQTRVLETAYFAGFFEWPRDSTGEEVAESLDIAPSTFHKHLRLGEKKVIGAIFHD